MKIILILSYLCLFTVFIHSQSNQEAEKIRRIEGVVTDFFGVPWEGAIIRLKSKGEVYKSLNGEKQPFIEKETKTDSIGRYSFTDLPEDSFEITLQRVGNIGTLEEKKLTGLLFARKTYKFDFGVEVGAISECGYLVTGFVKDEKGQNIEGAKVSVLNGFNQRIFSATTDKDGLYKLTICNAGQYVIFANTPKFEIQTNTVIFQDPEDFLKKVNFNLKPLSREILNWRK